MKHPDGCGCGRCTQTKQPTIGATVIAPAVEIKLVTRAKCRRLLLPIERGETGELVLLELQPGDVFRLRPKPRSKDGVTVTVLRVDQVTLADCARPWITAGRAFAPDERVWRVELVLGDRSEFFEKHREEYLKAKGVGLTDDPRKAVKGEPAVTTAEQLKISCIAAEKRTLEARQRLRVKKRVIEAALNDLRSDGYEYPPLIEKALRYQQRSLATIDRLMDEAA